MYCVRGEHGTVIGRSAGEFIKQISKSAYAQLADSIMNAVGCNILWYMYIYIYTHTYLAPEKPEKYLYTPVGTIFVLTLPSVKSSQVLSFTSLLNINLNNLLRRVRQHRSRLYDCVR